METHELITLWSRIDAGLATEQERIDAAFLSGEARDSTLIPRLLNLLDDENGEVRYYALQSLALDFHHRDPSLLRRCWEFLRVDPDEYVRGMAATCLGHLFLASRSREVFAGLVKELKRDDQPANAKASLYGSLFKLAGRPPFEWPGLHGQKAFEEADIDWQVVAWLADQMDP